MNLNLQYRTIFCTIVLSCCMLTTTMNAQETGTPEPAIPVYIVCPYHSDSLKKAYEQSLASGSGFVSERKYDTLQTQLQRSSAENTAHFTWLYMLIALLGVMNIALLFSFARLRKELQEIRTSELHQKYLSLPPPLETPVAATVEEIKPVVKRRRAATPRKPRTSRAKKPG
ncbi:MAG TPA: hypothetical protein VMU30_01445 [Bacteroidota bacterium]|nr:hypothetical protein [Bacteroidota bacterium]